MFLGGIWCSAKKPPTVTVVKPTVTELCALEMEGMRLYTQYVYLCMQRKFSYTDMHTAH